MADIEVQPDEQCCDSPDRFRPMVVTGRVGKAAFLDGQRGKTKDWQDMKQVAKLEKEKANLPTTARDPIQKEINNLKKVKK